MISVAGLPVSVALKGQPGALVRFQLFQIGNRDTTGAGKAFRRFGGVAVGIKGGLQGGATFGDVTVGLSHRDIPDEHGKAARRGIGVAVAVCQVIFSQQGVERGPQGITHASQGFWR